MIIFIKNVHSHEKHTPARVSIQPKYACDSSSSMESKLAKAYSYALEAHKGKKRKASDVPYIVHPMDVASVLMKNGASTHIIVAGFLHDTIEDAGKTREDIEVLFGTRVARLVVGASEPKHLRNKDSKQSWKDRKSNTITKIAKADYDLKLLSLADKLSNLRDIQNDLVSQGEQFWEIMNAGIAEQEWYYRSMLKSFRYNEQIELTNSLRN